MKVLLALVMILGTLGLAQGAYASEEDSPCAVAAIAAALKQARIESADPEESPVSAHVQDELSPHRLYWVSVDGGLSYDVETSLNAGKQDCQAIRIGPHRWME